MRYFNYGMVIYLLAASTSIGDDKFAAEVRIQAGGEPIDVGGFRGAAPFLGDIDGDGLNDLLVGQDELGRLRIYRNVGTRAEPRFDGFEWFRVNGQIVELPGHGLFRPQLADLNGDGKSDIVAPSQSGMILWYPRTAAGEFADAEIVRLANGQVLIAGANAGCHVVDWDGDGDSDLIISGRSTFDGPLSEVWIVENKGSPPSLSLATSLSLEAPRPLEVDGEPIKGPQREAYPFVADWNRDGKWDLLLSLQDGSIVLYENKGDRRSPRLAAARQLIEPPRRGQRPPDADIVNRGTGAGICVTDWDNDGMLDILIGDAQWETLRPEAPDNAADQLETTRREAGHVLSEYRRLRGIYSKVDPATQAKQRDFIRQTREKSARRLEELREEISKFETAMQPERKSHGYVWLLRRMNPQ